MQVNTLCIIICAFFIIIPPVCNGFVIIDPVTGREIEVNENETSNEAGNEEYLSQNVAISPGHFVRGRTSNLKLKYAPNNNNNRRMIEDERDISQSLNEETFRQPDNTNVQNKQAVGDNMGQEYFLPNGTPIYKFYKRNPYGR